MPGLPEHPPPMPGPPQNVPPPQVIPPQSMPPQAIPPQPMPSHNSTGDTIKIVLTASFAFFCLLAVLGGQRLARDLRPEANNTGVLPGPWLGHLMSGAAIVLMLACLAMGFPAMRRAWRRSRN